jgi:hypothetical protein
VTKDLVPTLERKIGYILTTRVKDAIRELENEFLSQFQPYAPQDFSFVTIDAEAMSESLSSAVASSPYPVISLDRVYIPKAAAFLDVTRRTDPATGAVCIGERAGAAPLPEQFGMLREYSEIALADVGAFEGTTLTDICSSLERRGVMVKQVILGVAGDEALNRLNGVRPVRAMQRFRFYEWIELRDLFGIDGRAVPGTGKRFMPYCENLQQWASISAENEPMVRELCTGYNGKLLRTLEGYDLGMIGESMQYRGGV